MKIVRLILIVLMITLLGGCAGIAYEKNDCPLLDRTIPVTTCDIEEPDTTV